MNVAQRMQGIHLIIFDVDGVLTDGRLFYGEAGELFKVFHARDGSAIKRLLKNDIEVALITAKKGGYITKRAQDLGIRHVFQGIADKKSCLIDLQKGLKLNHSQTCYVGDDEIDLECLKLVGLAIAPKDALERIKGFCHFVTKAKGGFGVAVEVAEMLLDEKGRLKNSYRGNTHVMIPARYGSTRFPGKPLKKIAGKAMVQRVYETAASLNCSSVVILTDDERILDAAKSFGAKAAMTSSFHKTGTDRLAEYVQRAELPMSDIVINFQGDEPLVPLEWLEKLKTSLEKNPGASIATLATSIKTSEEFQNPNVVKVVLSKTNRALYFSRSPIPFLRDGQSASERKIYRHIGLYAYRVVDLLALSQLPSCGIEDAESLEQLRALYDDRIIMVSLVEDKIPGGIDTPEDLERVEMYLEAQEKS